MAVPVERLHGASLLHALAQSQELRFGIEIEGGGKDYEQDATCWECDGSGYEWHACEECSGTGFVEPDCETCEGTGVIEDEEGEEWLCPDCDGRGYEDVECEECDGTGEVRYECEYCDGLGYYEEERLDIPSDWQAKSEHCGVEVISPPFPSGQEAWLRAKREIQDVCNELHYCGFEYSDSGIHVHVEARHFEDKELKAIYGLFWLMQKQIYDVFDVDPMRYGWCDKLSSDIVRKVYQAKNLRIDLSRYLGLNLTALFVHGTIEFRLFNGYIHNPDYAVQAVEFARLLVTVGAMRGREELTWGQAKAIISEYLEGVHF